MFTKLCQENGTLLFVQPIHVTAVIHQKLSNGLREDLCNIILTDGSVYTVKGTPQDIVDELTSTENDFIEGPIDPSESWREGLEDEDE